MLGRNLRRRFFDKVWNCYVELAKIRLTAMVVATTVVGYVLTSLEPICWTRLVLTALGTALAAAGAGAFNQVLEVGRDAKMERTRCRPLPSGAISSIHAFLFALVATLAGFSVLYLSVNPLTAWLGLANVLLYTLAYTPLKTRSSLSTLIGAICGAMPPMMGGTGATGRFASEALVLAAILFVWQLPHFLSLAWLYRADYANAGFRMLPVVDPSGRHTCLTILVSCFLLSSLALVAGYCGIVDNLVCAMLVATGLGLLAFALQLHVDKTRRNARRVFLATLAYLPLVLLLMVAGSLRAAPNTTSSFRLRAQEPAIMPQWAMLRHESPDATVPSAVR